MEKILLADDSNVAQRMGKEILSAEGFEVVTVSNGQAALKMLQEFVPALILADVFMPVKSGYELCEFVKSQARLKHVPVVLLVGAMEPYDPDEGRKVKADGVLTKPLQSSSLVKVVKELLASAKPSPPPPPPVPVVSVQETAPEEEDTEAPPAEERLEISQELGDQPMAAFGDLLESPGEPEAEPATSEETPLTELLSRPFPPPPETEAVLPAWNEGAPAFEESTAPEGQPVAEALPGTEFLVQSSGVEEIEPAELQQPPIADILQTETPSPENIVWTVEPAKVTAEDEKLFDQPASDWEGLTKMVEAEDAGSSGSALAWEHTEQASAAAVLPEAEAPAAPPSSLEPDQTESAVELAPEVEAPAEAPSSLASDQTEAAVGFVPEEVLPEPALVPPQQDAVPEKELFAVDPARIEHLVRQAVEEMMPQIVDRIVRSVGIILSREKE